MSIHEKEIRMIEQPIDKFEPMKDKRPWAEIQEDAGYWQKFWQQQGGAEKPVVANTVHQFMLKAKMGAQS
jgi:hypothetical protein